MKKLLYFMFFIIFLTGCGGKKLECVSKEATKEYVISETISFSFDKNGSEIKKGKYSLQLNLNDEYSNYLNKFKSDIILAFDNLYSLGVKRRINVKDNYLKFVLSYNATDYDNETKKKLVLRSLYVFGDYIQVKNELEKDGYICNVKD